jgi:membrane protease YdiL (CAAX protease family)
LLIHAYRAQRKRGEDSSRMDRSPSGAKAILLSALAAVLLTIVVSGVWSGLLAANLQVRPDMPWSAFAMLIVLTALWWWLRGGRVRSPAAKARRINLRDEPLPFSFATWAVFSGLIALVGLVSFWIVIHQLIPAPARSQADYSRRSVFMTVTSFTTAAVSGALAEEAGFRGFLQGAMERRGFGPLAILIAALGIAPLHALTQGFVRPTMLFYICVDLMLGTLAYLTKSIRPGIIVHAIGLFIFFSFVWPNDGRRRLVWRDGADTDFWINVAVTVTFAILAGLAILRLDSVVRVRGSIWAERKPNG